MTDSTPCHRTVILRCWSEDDGLESGRFWRFHAHWLDTDQRESFADFDSLLASLGEAFGQGEE